MYAGIEPYKIYVLIFETGKLYVWITRNVKY